MAIGHAAGRGVGVVVGWLERLGAVMSEDVGKDLGELGTQLGGQAGDELPASLRVSRACEGSEAVRSTTYTNR